MEAHADNCWQADAPEEVKSQKHPTWYRDFSGIFYLNDDYEGGEIVFKNLDLSIKPKKGMFVGFKANDEYTHQVMPIKNTDRYTIAVWYSKRLEYSE
jgi:predicted 2-oxoglutarate/Fe(II)-dependent dioxygenase YbiX